MSSVIDLSAAREKADKQRQAEFEFIFALALQIYSSTRGAGLVISAWPLREVVAHVEKSYHLCKQFK